MLLSLAGKNKLDERVYYKTRRRIGLSQDFIAMKRGEAERLFHYVSDFCEFLRA